MYPLLLKIGPIPIHTYGVMVALGFILALTLIRKLSARSGLDSERIADFTFWGMMVGLLGARLLFVVTRLDDFARDPISIFKVWEGGLVFWGGPLAVVPWGYWYLRKHQLPFWKVADIIACGLTLGHIIGRFGCVAAGCCYGRPVGDSIAQLWGIRLYSSLVDPNLRGILLHPVQLYESAALSVLLLGMLAIFRKKVFDGQVFLTYLMSYPIIRSILETFRGDLIRGFVIDDLLSTSQFISIFVFIIAAGMLVFRLKQVKAAASGAPILSAQARK